VVAGAAVIGTVALTLTVLNLVVTRSVDGLGFDEVADTPHRQVAIVFGAFVHADGTPSNALADRIDGAVALFRAGRVDHLLVTGDNSRTGYDEVTVMRDRAIAAGVPASAITRDYAGLDTYDSCIRASRVFGVRDAVLVTQDYHLARALFLCRNAGIDAVGLRIPDWQHRSERSPTVYPTGMAVNYTLREWLARVKAVIESEVTHPEPKVGGPFVGLTET
jgi:vancomycin permeability regulator SanA